jgi:NADH-quinone oxidoreductase subunit N
MYPIIVLSITGLITLFLGLENPKSKTILPATLFFLLVALASNLLDWNQPGTYFNNMIAMTNGTILVQSIIILATLSVVLISSGQFTDESSHPAEYYALMQFAIVGAIIMVSFNNMIMLFLGLEILSIALYVLTGSDKSNLRGNEAALKYFLMGAFATGILLFGMAMLYGATGSFDLGSGASSLAGAPAVNKVFFYIGIVFTLIGLLFKISAAPFHFWTADVYQGAPTVFTAFMATVVKAGVIFAIYRLFASSFVFEYPFWSKIVIGIVALSLVIGNVTAVLQDNFKRILAYSSISQAAFMLMAFLGLVSRSGVINEKVFGNLAFYSASYVLATVAALGVLIVVSKNSLKDGRPNENVEVFNGLFKRNPDLAIILFIAMLSLSGIPLTSGFWGKFFVFNDAISRGYLWILILAILMSAVSLYYYFKPVLASFKASTEEPVEVKPLQKFVLYLSAILTVALGLAPALLRDMF